MKLNNLRKKLADIDRRLLAVVKDRQNLSHEIGGLKREAGLGTRDYHQETQVVERGRAMADELGLSPSLVEELLLVLIRASLTVQEQDRVSATGEGSGKRVLVIGGAGKMGLWMARFLASQGYSVEIADPEGPVEGFDHVTDWKNLTLDHDVIVVAAPLHISNEILMALAERRPPGLVFDVGSLKSPLRAGLQALTKNGVRVASVHPMFGPTTKLLSGRHVIFINLGHEEAVAQAREIFSPTMATLLEMDLDNHDRLIAYVLGLSHALNVIFLTALADSGETAPRLANISSTTFDAQLAVAGSVAQDNPYLYFEIQTLNEYGSQSLDALEASVKRFLSVVKNGDKEGFRELMERGELYFADLAKGMKPSGLG